MDDNCERIKGQIIQTAVGRHRIRQEFRRQPELLRHWQELGRELDRLVDVYTKLLVVSGSEVAA